MQYLMIKNHPFQNGNKRIAMTTLSEMKIKNTEIKIEQGGEEKEHIEYLQRKRGEYPVPTVDIIIEIDDGFILIERKNPPYGWAIPGGFVNQGESLETAAIREAKEETGLEIKGLVQLHTYSEPNRDPRFHTISTVFVAKGIGKPKADTDAKSLKIFTPETLPQEFAFDHKKIIQDYLKWKKRK